MRYVILLRGVNVGGVTLKMAELRELLEARGYSEVRTVLAPAWTTDWMSDAGKRKLEAFGIAPPTGRRPAGAVPVAIGVRCPNCGSLRTRELSHFGSTSCKALYECRACLEPFDHFKVH